MSQDVCFPEFPENEPRRWGGGGVGASRVGFTHLEFLSWKSGA